jgi:hypothetical protein
MPTQHKATRASAISMQMKTQICFESNLSIYGSLFATTWFVFANQPQFPNSKSNTLVET